MQKYGDFKQDSSSKIYHGNRPELELFFPSFMDTPTPSSSADEKALRMMQKMGYRIGSGLGKNEQGITEYLKIGTNLGKRGLGLKLNNLHLSDDPWDFCQDEILVKEKVHWLENDGDVTFTTDNLNDWVKEGLPNDDVIGNWSFCDKEILKNVFKAKDIFDEIDLMELCQARAKANPFETIRSVFFMNRAALKIANIDAATDFMFTSMEKNEKFDIKEGPIYFADVCAGPGGFTEYILWRKKWFYKGFGLTLRDDHDFKVSESTCASNALFQALYGTEEDGNVCNPGNLIDFTERVKNETDGQGVHFMMADGGFCVDGQENLQEVLSKHIYLCQCLLALKILRPNGHFVTKVFDVFTPFSVGLLYLMYLCFEKVGIIKPNASRPANSERYFICSSFKVNPLTNIIREYMWKIVIRLWEIRTLPDRDVLEIVPGDVLQADKKFFNYILESNTSLGKKQIIALQKLAQFARNPTLLDTRQEDIRRKCLEFWKIPDEKRKIAETCKVEQVLNKIELAPEVLKVQPRHINSRKILEATVADLKDWHYTYLFSSENMNRTNFYAGIGNSKVYRLQNFKWVKVKDLELVQGTLLYGEFVKETSISESNKVSHRYSLHIIDAVFLGSMDLQGLTFQERAELIKIYCKSVNKESQSKYSVRVRPKVLHKLKYLPQDSSLMKNEVEKNLIVDLPRIGYKSKVERYEVNSILLMKTNKCQSFQSTHVLRVQIFNTKEEKDGIHSITFNEVKKTIENLLI